MGEIPAARRARHRRHARPPVMARAIIGPGAVAAAGTLSGAALALVLPGVLPAAAPWALALSVNGAALFASWRMSGTAPADPAAVARPAPQPLTASSPVPIPVPAAPAVEDGYEVLARLLALAEGGRARIGNLAEGIRRGEQLPVPQPRPVPTGTSWAAEVERALVRGQDEAEALIAAVTGTRQAFAAQSGQQIDILVHIARRLSNLVGRIITQLDAIERSVEDPDELHELFKLDNLVVRSRRAVESLAVLGGGSPRQIRTPAEIQAVLRLAVGATEQYARMQIVSCPPGTIPGYAVVDTANLLSELLENSAAYSRPETRVHIRAQRAEDGSLAVLIEDQALAMPEGQIERLNMVLAQPERADLTGQLRESRIGLIVVSRIAQRHGATVRLSPRTGAPGYRATVILPPHLVTAPADPSPTEDTMPLACAPHPAPGLGGPRPSLPAAAPPPRTPGSAPLPVRTPQRDHPRSLPAARPTGTAGFAGAVAAAEALRGTPRNQPANQGE